MEARGRNSGPKSFSAFWQASPSSGMVMLSSSKAETMSKAPSSAQTCGWHSCRLSSGSRREQSFCRRKQRCCGRIVRVFQRAELLQEMHHRPAEAGLGELHADNGVLAYCGANSLCSNPQSVYCDRSRKLSFPLFSLKGKKKILILYLMALSVGAGQEGIPVCLGSK